MKPPKSKNREDQKNSSNGRGNPQEGTGRNKVTVKQEVEEEENYLESILQFKIYDSLKSHFEDAKNENPEPKHDSEDEEQLRQIMEESKLQYEKEEKERKALLRSVYNEEEELRKAIELSTKEMDEKRKEGMGSPKGKISESEVIKNTMISKRENTSSNYRNSDEVDDELLELSKKEARKQNEVNVNKQRRNFLGNPRKDSVVPSNNNSNVDVRNGNDSADELKKVLELSLRDTEHSESQPNRPKKAAKLEPGELDRTSRINSSSCSDAEQLKKVLELSKKESQQKQEEMYQVNESQEDELEDYYDLEVPDFVRSDVSNGVNNQISKKDDTLSSTSSLSRCQNNARKDENTDRICSSLSAASSTSCQQKPSATITAVEKLHKDSINESETVFVDSQDMDEEEDAVVERFNKTFGKIVSGKQAGKHNDSLAIDDDDDAILVDNEDVVEDQNIINNMQSRLQDKGARKCKLNGMNDYQNNSPTSFTDDAILINSQDEDVNESMARRLQERYDNDAILVDSQDVDADESTAQKLQERYDKEGSSGHQSSNYADDAILLDSQDDVEVENTNSDYEIALQLQKEFNKQANNTNNIRPSSSSFTSTSNNFVRESATNQIASYREEQKKRFKDAKTGKSPKTMSPGLAFRQKAEAIARGKESLLAVVRPLGLGESNPRRRPDKRGHDGTIKNQVELDTSPHGRNARKSCPTSTRVHTETRTTAAAMDPSDACLVFPSSSPRPQEYQPRSRKQSSSVSSSDSSSLVFPGSLSSSGGCDQQSTPGGSFSFPSSSCRSRGLSTSYQSDSSNGFVFPGSAEFSSSPSPRPSSDTLISNASQSNSTSDDGIKGSGSSAIINGPKCSKCGQTGHRKGTKRCPYYYTEEAQRKREEISRKRKEKREEEERQFQTSIDAVTAEQLRMAEQAEQLRRQVEEFNRQNNNLPKVVEDAMKYLKKRRRK